MTVFVANMRVPNAPEAKVRPHLYITARNENSEIARLRTSKEFKLTSSIKRISEIVATHDAPKP